MNLVWEVAEGPSGGPGGEEDLAVAGGAEEPLDVEVHEGAVHPHPRPLHPLQVPRPREGRREGAGGVGLICSDRGADPIDFPPKYFQ